MCGLRHWHVTARDLEALWGQWAFGPTCWAAGTSFLSTDQTTTKVIALGAGQLRGDYGLVSSVAGVNHPVPSGSSKVHLHQL